MIRRQEEEIKGEKRRENNGRERVMVNRNGK